jgi:hypothetical protein
VSPPKAGQSFQQASPPNPRQYATQSRARHLPFSDAVVNGLGMDTAITDATFLKVSPDAIGSDVDGEVVLINIKSGAYIGLDMVGSEVWRRLQGGTAFGDLCTGLKAHFRGDGEVIEGDARVFVSTLVQSGLVLSEG